MLETIDTLIGAEWLLPIEPKDVVLRDHGVAIRDGRIVAVLDFAEALQRFAPKQQLFLSGHVLLPGLINLHTHAAMSLLRGLADDLALMEWLNAHIWPAERAHVSAEFVFDGTLLACAEMLRGGITCFNDMYFFPESAARAARQAGMRATVGMIVIDAPTAYAKEIEGYLSKGLALHDEYSGDARIRTMWAPHAPYTIGDATFEKIQLYAAELNLGIHIHVHETRDEIEQSIEKYGLRPLQRLRKLGLLGPNLIAVHTVHLNPSEIELLAQFGCHSAHCPASNLKLGSGIAPVAQMLAQDVNVGLGTDGAASNNRLDLWSEMRLAVLLAKGTSGNPTSVYAHAALRMATVNAARALCRDDEIGSLVEGKAADLIAVNLDQLELSPCFDIASHLVYVAGRHDVSHVWVGGELVVEHGRLLHIDEAAILATARRWQRRIGPSTSC